MAKQRGDRQFPGDALRRRIDIMGPRRKLESIEVAMDGNRIVGPGVGEDLDIMPQFEKASNLAEDTSYYVTFASGVRRNGIWRTTLREIGSSR